MTPSAIRKSVLSCCTGGMAVAAIVLAARFHRPVADAVNPRTTTSGVVRVSAIVATPAPPASPAGARSAPPPVRHEVTSRATAAARTTAVPGMVVAIDPETGALGPPSPEQMREIQSHRATTFRASPDGFLEIHHPDGAVGLVLGDRAQSYSVVRVTAAGRRAFGCLEATSDSAAAAAPLAGEDR